MPQCGKSAGKIPVPTSGAHHDENARDFEAKIQLSEASHEGTGEIQSRLPKHLLSHGRECLGSNRPSAQGHSQGEYPELRRDLL